MKHKVLTICKSLLWCFIILLFPITSGTLSAILSLDIVATLFLQGFFMVMALIPPAIFVLIGKWNWREIGFAPFDFRGCRKVFYFIPLLVIFIPVAIKGFYLKSTAYVLGNFFLYLFVGISEEIYFRGIIPKCLKKEFSTKGIMLWSTLIFAIGHLATALSGSNAFEVVLSVFNAALFGWMAIEMTLLSRNIFPAMMIHFFFDFETKIVAMHGSELLIAESVRGILMFIIAIGLAIVYKKLSAYKKI